MSNGWTASLLIDMTQLKAAEEARTRTGRELASIVAASPVAIFMLDKDGIVRFWNASAERVFGYSVEEAVGKLPPYLVDEHMADFDANLERVLNDPAPTGALATRRRRKDGQIIDVSVRWARVTDADGHPIGVMYVVSDVTRQGSLEAQLRQAQKMEAVGNLTGGLAHDFNNLLGIIIGNLDLLRDRQTDEPLVDELAREALDAALRGADLTRRLLAFARRQPLQPERLEVNELVAGITHLLKRTLGEQVEIRLELGEDLWPVIVDPAQLEASLTNLATNARDAMPRGGQLTIVTANSHLDADYASQHTEVQSGDYVLIEVSDTGTGISPEITVQIFEPFFTTKEPGKGTGLGLSMVFGFIKQTGGHISVYSEVGIGTTFRLYLPRADQHAEQAAATHPEPMIRGKGERVLAVEDNPSLRRVVVRQLSELGYRVLEAEYVQSALDILEHEPADLLFTDVVMPGGVSGYELARAAQSRWPNMKVVLTSGFPESKINGTEGMINVRLLSKPYRRDDLGRTIREALAI
jgi:PAS domain S-box-containing protein